MKVPQQAEYVSLSRCPCGCGFVHLHLHDIGGEIFANAPFAPGDGCRLADGLREADHGPDFAGTQHAAGRA